MKLFDSSGIANHIVPFSNGALRAPHVKQIGPAFPLFLLYEDWVTTGEGADGVVLGGRPVTDVEPARQLGVHPQSVRKQRLRLEKHHYILATRTGRGYVIRVRKSKKWRWLQSVKRRQTEAQEIGANASIGQRAPDRELANSLNQNERTRSIRISEVAQSRSDILVGHNTDSNSPRSKGQSSESNAFAGKHLRLTRGGQGEVETSSKIPDIHPEMDLIAWMEKSWRDNPHTRKTLWKEPKYPDGVRRREGKLGVEAFRALWLKHLDEHPQPGLREFLKAAREMTNRNGGRGTGETIAERDLRELNEALGEK